MEIAKKQRDSNLELFRIIFMLLIVAHHYVANSGLMYENGPVLSNLTSPHSVFLLLFGAWGKTGLNCFVLFSGFFMCKSNITARKFLKLIGEWMFYCFAIYIVFLASGYIRFSWRDMLDLFVPVNSIDRNFTSAYFVFFLCIPFLNILIRNMNERQHVRLLLLCFFIYVLLGTFQRVTMNYVSWFIVLYLLSSYIRLYPKKLFANRRFWGIALCCSLAVSIGSIFVGIFLQTRFGIGGPYAFVEDSNTLLALTDSLCGFMYFKNIRMRYNRFVNTVAASTFGVLCIHANSDTMRRWLWQDILNNVGAYGHSWGYLHAFASVICVFTACTIIDMLRIRFIERPFLRLWDRKQGAITAAYRRLSEKVCKRLKIGE